MMLHCSGITVPRSFCVWVRRRSYKMLLKSRAQGGGGRRGGKKDGTSICGIYISEGDIGSSNNKTSQDRCITSEDYLRPGPQWRDINSRPLAIDSSFCRQIKKNRNASIRNWSVEI